MRKILLHLRSSPNRPSDVASRARNQTRSGGLELLRLEHPELIFGILIFYKIIFIMLEYHTFISYSHLFLVIPMGKLFKNRLQFLFCQELERFREHFSAITNNVSLS